MTRRAHPGPGALEDARAILNGVRRLVQSLRAFEKQAQALHGFGAAQMFILHVLQQEEPLTVGELAERTATDQSSASLAVGKLIADGYVRRAPGIEDRRQVRLSLTPQGRAVVRKAPPAAQERIMESVRAMSPAQRRNLRALLEKLLAGLVPVDKGRAPMLFQDEVRPTRKRTQRTRKK